MDMIIKDARLADEEGAWDIGITDGRIAEVARRIDAVRALWQSSL